MSSMFPRVAFLVLASVALSSLAGRADAVEVLRTQGAPTVNTSVGVAPPETALDAGDYYVFDGRRVPLLRSEEVVGVRFAAGASKSTVDESVRALGWEVETSGQTSMRGIAVVRIAKATASKGGKPSGSTAVDALAALNALPEVSFAFPVLVNPTTRNRLLLTDEIVAKPLPDVEAAALAAEFDLVVVEQLWATCDEYVLRLRDAKRQDPLAVANAIAESGLVVWAEPNFVQEFTRFATPNDPRFPEQWHLDNTGQGGGTVDADVDAPEAWDVTTGSASITIAIIDDGVEKTHEDLVARIYVNPGEVAGDGIDNDGNGYVDDVSGWDFSNNDADASPGSTDDHGTAVAGLAAATGNNGVGVSGVCQECRILPVKIFEGPAFAGDSVVANAIRYAASLADVLSNSWGGGAPSSAIQSAIQWANTNGRGGIGVPVFFASGNSAGAYVSFTISGVPAGTHRFRWQYIKDVSLSDGEDTAWLGWVELPGGEWVDFESGSLPAGFTTGGDASWSISLDRTRADEGRCLTRSAKAGTITDNQATYLDAVKTVAEGSLRYGAWVSSELNYDDFEFWFDDNDDGTWTGPYLGSNGVPTIITDVDYPAAHPESIAIGASTDLDCRAAYSQYGTALDLVAPSSGGSSSVTTTDRTGSAGYDAAGDYTSTFGGTSAATPLAAGIAGLLLSRNANLTEGEVRQHLQDTSDKVGLDAYDVSGRNDRYGHGRVNAAGALQALPCTGSIDPTSASYGSGGGSGNVDVTAACDWTAVSNAAWITVTSGASGSGNGTVGYTIASNTNFARTGTITIAGQMFTVSQSGSCTAVLSPTSANFAAGGGAGSFGVTAGSGCGWTAVSNDSWITVTSGSTGSGDGSVDYSVAPNSAGARTGTITAATQTFTVNQDAAPFTPVDTGLQGLGESLAAWGDYDNDGDLDLLMTGCSLISSTGGCFHNKTNLYRNDGAGVFTAVSTSLPGVMNGSIAWGDYDADGDLDIFLSGCEAYYIYGCYWSTASIYRNEGGGSFTDISAGLPTRFAESTWGDYDNDGDLDLLLGSSVYRNDGGTFVSVWTGPEKVGAWGDYDNDGDLDLALSGNSTSRIYRNDGATNFVEETGASLLGMSDGYPRWGDYDNDGDLDLLLGGDTGGGSYVTKLYRNDGAGVFTDVPVGLPGAGTVAYYNAWVDLDNDGDLDVLLGGATLYRNDGADVFVDSGESFNPYAAACGDYDNDGDLDLVGSAVSSGTYLFQNGAATANTVPGAPAGVTSVGGSLAWSPSTDAETPAAGLTYNLRVGTTPGSTDIVSPMASAAGYRRVVRTGGVNHGTSAFLTGLAPSTYYWSVQAVDTAFAGSPFASEVTFTVCSTAIDPAIAAFDDGGGTAAVSVSAAPGCAWAAISAASWVTVTGGATGNGNGTVTYSVAPSMGMPRTGVIFIGDQALMVNQGTFPTLSIGNVGLSEGDEDIVNAVFTVRLSAASGQQVTVDYATADGTATAGSDYLAVSGSLTFTPWTITRDITVVVNGDTLDEPNETFFVNLSNPINATISDGQGQGTISDDDGEPGFGCPKLMGSWAYGPTEAVATSGNHAYFGSGPVLLVADVSAPATLQVVGEVVLGGTVEAVVVSGGYAYVADGSGLRVVDVSTPPAPVEVGSSDTPGWANGVAVSGNFAYIADWTEGLRVIDVSTPWAPAEVGSYDMQFAMDVAVSGSYAYVVDEYRGLRVIDVSTPSAPVEVGFYDAPDWSYGVVVSGGYAYVAGGGAGLRVVDVSTPSAPVEVGFYDTPSYARSVAVSGGYAYVADGSGGLRVVDVSTPSAPVEVGSYDTPGSARDVAVSAGFACVVDSHSGLRVIDVSTPSAPVEVGLYDTPGWYAHGVAVSGSFAYVTDDDEGLRLIDVSTPSAPGEVGSYDTMGSADDVAVADGYAYVADGSKGLRVIDVSTPSAPIEVGFYDTPGSAYDVAVADGYAYVADGSKGLRVIDVSTPSASFEVGFYDTPEYAYGVAVSGGYAYVADGDAGLRVIDVSTPSAPVEVGFYDTPGSARDVAAADGYAYVADRWAGLRVIDVSTPAAPVEVGFYETPGWAYGIVVSGGYAYAADDRKGLRVIDVSTPSAPVEVGFYDTPGSAKGVAVSGGLVYLADGEAGLWIFGGCTVFCDGFELGDASAWSSVVGGSP